MPVNVEPGDHIIFYKPELTKNRLARVLGENLSYLSVEVLSDAAIGTINIKLEDIMANLGTNPKFGETWAGVKMEYELDKKFVDSWGPVSYMLPLTDEFRKNLDEAFIEVTANLIKHGYERYLPIDITYVKPNSSEKIGGIYKRNKKGEESITICPPEECYLNADYLRLIMYHEFGHKLFVEFTPNRRYPWIESYKQKVSVYTPNQKEMEEVRSIVGASSSLKEAKKELKEVNELYLKILKSIIAYVHKNYKLKDNVDEYLAVSGEEFLELWPSSIEPINWGDYSASVSDYGNKKPVEDFCECFAYYMAGYNVGEFNTKRLEGILQVTINNEDRIDIGVDDRDKIKTEVAVE